MAEIVPRIEAIAIRLTSLANINRTVHLSTYSQMISEIAIKMDKATKDAVEQKQAAERNVREEEEASKKKARMDKEVANAAAAAAALEAMRMIEAAAKKKTSSRKK